MSAEHVVLAAAYDLRVFFFVVGNAAAEVRPADLLGFITAQRTGGSGGAVLQRVDAVDENRGVATSTVARRLSIISGFFGYLQARGDITANPVPRGLPTRRERSRPGQGVPLTRRTRRPGKLRADKGYDADHHRRWLRDRGITPRITRRGIDTGERLGRHRWKIERTIAWLTGYRRLTIRYERHATLFGAFLSLAAALTCWKKLPT